MKQSLKGAQPKGYSPTGPGEVRSIFIILSDVEGFSDGSVGKESACSTGDTEMQVQSLIPWSRKGQPTLVFFCLENSMDRGAWWATVCGVAKSWT